MLNESWSILFQEEETREIRATLRMDLDVYQILYDKLKHDLRKKCTNYRELIPPQTRLALTMRFLALHNNNSGLACQHVKLLCMRLVVL